MCYNIFMRVKDMHMMRLKEEAAKKALLSKNKKLIKQTPLAKEIEIRRENFIRGILANTERIVNQQLALAELPVSEKSRHNETVLRSTTALLDRAFGKPKESIDFTGNVQFSLENLARERDTLVDVEVIPLENMLE